MEKNAELTDATGGVQRMGVRDTNDHEGEEDEHRKPHRPAGIASPGAQVPLSQQETGDEDGQAENAGPTGRPRTADVALRLRGQFLEQRRVEDREQGRAAGHRAGLDAELVGGMVRIRPDPGGAPVQLHELLVTRFDGAKALHVQAGQLEEVRPVGFGPTLRLVTETPRHVHELAQPTRGIQDDPHLARHRRERFGARHGR